MSRMTAHDMRIRLDRLRAERSQARSFVLRDHDVFMEDLEDELRAARDAYVGLAVTEIATLRGELFGRQVG